VVSFHGATDLRRVVGGGALPAPLPPELTTPAPSICVLIPTLNEARNLPYVLTRIPSEYEVVIVDGRSTDGTVAVATALRPSAQVIEQNGRGKGDAIVCGFAAARSEIIVMLDGDGSARVEEIPRFIEALLAGADFAKGSRFLGDGGSADITLLRRLGNYFLTRLVNLLFGARYTDLCYGYNAFWADRVADLGLDADGFEVETQLNIRACKAGLLVTEVPSFEDSRIHGTSNLHAVRDGLRVLRTILRERFARDVRTAAVSTSPLRRAGSPE
jgi:glycosyltransferase involved in cell wall biosynthesis